LICTGKSTAEHWAKLWAPQSTNRVFRASAGRQFQKYNTGRIIGTGGAWTEQRLEERDKGVVRE
jgi:hypothetical protein